MADKAPGATKKRRGRPPKAKAPDPSTLPIEDAAEAAAAAAVKDGSDGAEPQSGDKPPGAEPGAAPRKPRSRVTKKGTQQIEDALRELLQMPAVPASIFGDRWAAQHFTQQGASLANKIAVVSERNPVLRSWCERMLQGESLAVLLMASVMYAGPALLHWGIVPGGELLGVPVIKRRQAPEPTPTEGTIPTEPEYGREAPEPQPFGGVAFEGDNGVGPPVWEPAAE